MPTPEARARQQIDQLLAACGWEVKDRAGMNLDAARGVAVREFPVEGGFADYLLLADRKAVGVVEAGLPPTCLPHFQRPKMGEEIAGRLRQAVLRSAFEGSL